MSKNRGRNSHQKRELKEDLLRRYGPVCQLCKERFSKEKLTLDHIVPLSLYPDWSFKNLQLACEPCNRKKADTWVDPWTLL